MSAATLLERRAALTAAGQMAVLPDTVEGLAAGAGALATCARVAQACETGLSFRAAQAERGMALTAPAPAERAAAQPAAWADAASIPRGQAVLDSPVSAATVECKAQADKVALEAHASPVRGPR